MLLHIFTNNSSPVSKQSIQNSKDDVIASFLAKMKAKAQLVEYGPAVDLTPADYQSLMKRMGQFRDHYLGMAFWFVVNMKENFFDALESVEAYFGKKIGSRIDFYNLIHPNYLLPYFQWVAACHELSLQPNSRIKPLHNSFRISLPLHNRDGSYYWYSQFTTPIQLDNKGLALNYLNTYYLERKWSPFTRKPFETYMQVHNEPDPENEKKLYAIMAPYVIDEFTNSELEIIALYANGMGAEAVTGQIGWSKHTLNEYNASIMKKARRFFQYDFRTAREFSLYCLERGFIYKR